MVLGLQYLVWRRVILPVIEDDMAREDDVRDRFWEEKANIRKKWGTSRPLRPSKEREWRLEQMYDDD